MTAFAVSREPDDRAGVLRASIGGNRDIGYYLVFRGEPDDVVEMLVAVATHGAEALPAAQYTDKRQG